MSKNSFPAGAYDDSKAPYNEKSYGNCSTCDGTGFIQDTTFCDEEIAEGNCSGEGCGLCQDVCTNCEGTGDKTEEQYEDEKESHMEDMRDEY